MSKIAVIADRETATYFRLTGVKRSSVADNKEEAEKLLASFFHDPSISLIIVTEQVLEWIEPHITKIRREKEYPLIISIPGKMWVEERKDTLAELIRKTVGVEIKVE
jgi:vacuolar-type H+-ATPase subunit F/Vma7